MESITLYSTGCPKCAVLESKLEDAGLAFNIISDQDIMIEKGFMSMPMMEVNDGPAMNFVQANRWLEENGYGD